MKFNTLGRSQRTLTLTPTTFGRRGGEGVVTRLLASGCRKRRKFGRLWGSKRIRIEEDGRLFDLRRWSKRIVNPLVTMSDVGIRLEENVGLG